MPALTAELTAIERAVLRAIAEKEKRGADVIRAQLSGLTVVGREKSTAGFFTYFDGYTDGPPDKSAVWTGMVTARMPGVPGGVGFMALIEHGRVVMLEGYTFGDDVLPDDLSMFELVR